MTKVQRKTKRRRSMQRNAIREIKKFQERGAFATKHLVPKSCFARVARDIAREVATPLRFREDAMDSLQTASEAYVTTLLRNANKIAAAHKRMTLQPMDLRLADSIVNNTHIDVSGDAPVADDADSDSDMDYENSADDEDTAETEDPEDAEESLPAGGDEGQAAVVPV